MFKWLVYMDETGAGQMVAPQAVFDTKAEALVYARDLATGAADGSPVQESSVPHYDDGFVYESKYYGRIFVGVREMPHNCKREACQ